MVLLDNLGHARVLLELQVAQRAVLLNQVQHRVAVVQAPVVASTAAQVLDAGPQTHAKSTSEHLVARRLSLL